MHDLETLAQTLNNLRGQKSYLEELLSKTATTLNALRDKQTRNQRVLSTHPTPRSKRKKIQQNRWRTGKTILTCENEERVIFDCLQVCENNIHTLEAIINPPETWGTSAGCYSSNSHAESDTASFVWQGWTEDVAVSPFEQRRNHPLLQDEIAPDTVAVGRTEAETRRPLRIPPRIEPETNSAFLVAPPNSAYTTNFALSPEASTFEPSAAHLQLPVTRLAQELDKLTISGLLASKRMDSFRRRRFSEESVAIGRLLNPLRPALRRADSCQSWPGSSAQREDQGGVGKTRRRRANSA